MSKQTAVEWFEKELQKNFNIEGVQPLYDDILEQAKEMEKQQKLELIQFLAEIEDFKEYSSMSIFIAEDYLKQFKNK